MESSYVSRETGISPCSVRQLLSQMHKVARKFFPEDVLPADARCVKAARAIVAKHGDPSGKRMMHVVAALIQAGKTKQEVADFLECSLQNVQIYASEWKKENGKN